MLGPGVHTLRALEPGPETVLRPRSAPSTKEGAFLFLFFFVCLAFGGKFWSTLFEAVITLVFFDVAVVLSSSKSQASLRF